MIDLRSTDPADLARAAAFQANPVALLEVDFSACAALLEAARADRAARFGEWARLNAARVGAALTRLVMLDANPAALELFGVEDIAVLRTRMGWFFKSEFAEAVITYLEEAYASGARWSGESRVYRIDRKVVDVLVFVAPQREAGLGYDRLHAAMIDITSFAEARRALARAHEAALAATNAKSDFLSAASHEIRTPLNAVLGLAQVLERSDLDHRQREVVGLIRRGGEQLKAIVDDILDLARVEAGRIAPAPEPVEVGPFFENLTRTWRPTVAAAGLELALRLDELAGARAMFDPKLVRQIVDNLVSNAVKFTPRGAIAITVARVSGLGAAWLEIAVSDTGPGIAPHAIEALWEPFARGDGAAASEGTGLGLSIVKKLVEALGGSVKVASSPGAGAVFSVRLPWVPVEAAPRRPATADSAPGPAPLAWARANDGAADDVAAERRLRVLVAEDNHLNQRVMAAMLDVLGAEPVFANDGEAAAARAETERFDLVFMDLHMPRCDGLEATRRIRAGGLNAATPIIGVTAAAMPADRARLLAAGVDDVVLKPIDGANLARAIDRWSASPLARSA